MAVFGLKEEINNNVLSKDDLSIVPDYESDRTELDIRAYIAGYKWQVTYFHLDASNQDTVREYDPNLDPTLMNYIRINDLVLYLENPLEPGIPDDLKGEAIIDADFIPNPNDLFIAKLMDGRSVIFVVEDVRRISYNNEDMFQISFKIYTQIDSLDDPFLTKLLNSVTETLYYNQDYRSKTLRPVFTSEEVETRKLYMNYMDELTRFWESKFITPDSKYFMMYKDSMGNLYYDPEIERFMRSVVPVDNFQKLEITNLADSDVTILDYLLDEHTPKKVILRYFNKKDPSKLYARNPYFMSNMYIGATYIIRPTEEPVYDSIEQNNTYIPKLDGRHYIFREPIYKVLDGYTLTDEEMNSLTKFEQLLLKTITGNIIERKDIEEIYKNILNNPEITDAELYYFIPVFLYIIRYALEVFLIAFV